MKTLQILFTIISALFLVALIPLAAIFGWAYALLCVIGALLFFGLMKLCKLYAPKDDGEHTENPHDRES